MKDHMVDANFPKTADGRVYHLGTGSGDFANRIITVGSHPRARLLASFLNKNPAPLVIESERGFLTITGWYTPRVHPDEDGPPPSPTRLSIISIGMGFPNMDFFVREARECLPPSSDMLVVRFGSCGGIATTTSSSKGMGTGIGVGTVVVPASCVSIVRNVDYYGFGGEGGEDEVPYWISRPVQGDAGLREAVLEALEEDASPGGEPRAVVGTKINAAADGFYASQGRATGWPDANEGILAELERRGVESLEMETHQLFHLARAWNSAKGVQGKIRVAAAQMVFADRQTRAFIAPNDVKQKEAWAGRVLLDVMARFEVEEE
ncbi:purine and uridine phosphorylase [Cylindrobasidium torrendii FP15055 ss-10]|uniref:Purine and uridine phosphorylase n=1 Tax=Cylindrobasidium torrendii FP15055 ss-10 TaxID=1314674 RepID=A0A0D7AVQ5_9AGAR|nr:purine and uridine phosphorylase [Cylindrobasidium torrendii FP15055 ss-10]